MYGKQSLPRPFLSGKVELLLSPRFNAVLPCLLLAKETGHFAHSQPRQLALLQGYRQEYTTIVSICQLLHSGESKSVHTVPVRGRCAYVRMGAYPYEHFTRYDT